MIFKWVNTLWLCALVVVSINIRRGGWLDRLVAHQKAKFYNDLLELAPLQIEAKIERAPPGYKDSEAWTIDSVMHLLFLISESEKAKPVRVALRRMMKPTRRLSMSRQKSYKMFPSLSKNIENYLYYDVDTDEDYSDKDLKYTGIPDDNAVIVVQNPVEARLPSAQISVRLLRDILEARAQAARIMPTTSRSTFYWKPMNMTNATAASGGVGDQNASETVTAASSGSSTSGSPISGSSTSSSSTPDSSSSSSSTLDSSSSSSSTESALRSKKQ